jgi:hypothetical protein
MRDFSDLRQKIDEAKRCRLPLPDLMSRLRLGEHAKKSAHCPFPGHEDKHKSFSVFKGDDGFWHWKCFAGCGDGDEITFLRKLKGCPLTDAMNLFLEEAGFPACPPHNSREYPKSPDSPESRKSPECLASLASLGVCVSKSPCVSVSPVSEGQCLDKELEKELKALAVCNACTSAEDKAKRKRFKLARDAAGVEKKIGRKLTTAELRLACDEWKRVSAPFLNAGDDHFTLFLAELTKVRVPTGEGDTVNQALENVLRLSDSDLPGIPGYPDAPKHVRKLAALHREMSRLRGDKVYFLSYRDAAKICAELTHQSAHTITLALVRIGLIEIVRKGKAGLNSRKAAEFRFLLPESKNGEAKIVA